MSYRVDNAVIMAAGIASRFIPLSIENPKALLCVKGEILIERQIRQLREAGIEEIIIVVGYKKEQFKYLKEKFKVVIIENSEYDSRNNHASLFAARNYIKNTYICSADNYFIQNPFTVYNNEAYYAAAYAEERTEEWCIRTDKEGYITDVTIGGQGSWYMLGHAFFSEKFSRKFLSILIQEYDKPETRNKLWEAIYAEHLKELPMQIRKYGAGEIREFDTLEELRGFDGKYLENSGSPVMQEIAEKMGCSESRINGIRPLKTGMTNHSFLFVCNQKRYIMRLPGEGTEQMIDRVNEAAVYDIIRDRQISDPVLYINSHNGHKISEYIEGARVCNPESEADVFQCMRLLRTFHEMKLVTEKEFDLFERIDFYEALRKEKASAYADYDKTKKEVFSLREYLDLQKPEKTLTHIDAVCDNFLLYQGQDGGEQVRLIDWEYAGMQDPHVDIAMFCIYAQYDKKQIDRTIQIYFQDSCSEQIIIKIYCYIAVCGLLWSNWCEYKSMLGVEFGGYAVKQYEYAKEYCKIVKDIQREEKRVAEAGLNI